MALILVPCPRPVPGWQSLSLPVAGQHRVGQADLESATRYPSKIVPSGNVIPALREQRAEEQCSCHALTSAWDKASYSPVPL